MPKGYKTDGSFSGKVFKKGERRYPEYGFQKGQRGKKAGHWINGQVIYKYYIYTFQPSHPRATKDGYVLRSHLTIEKILGRYLTRIEVVHHKGIRYPLGSIKNRQDDRPENLMVFVSQSPHRRFHKDPSNVKFEEIVFDGCTLKK